MNLLELALVVSDNTAADIVLDLAGGAGAVRERLQQLGLADISVDRSILQLLADIEGVDALPVSGGVTPAAWRMLTLAVAQTRRDAAERAFLNEPRDTATPDAMVRLLARIADGSAVGPAMRSSLLDILSRCDTGHDRICGWMPAGTRVAHKTGTIEGPPGRGRRYPRVVNDVGLVAMPDGRGCMALAVFVTGSAETADAQARAIARIARTVHDSFGANMRP